MMFDDYNIDENEAPESFRIDDDKTAEWAIKKIRAEQEEHDRLQALIDLEREDLDKKQQEIDARLDRKTGFLKGLLFDFFEGVEKKETKTQQSYKLLSGSLVYKKPSISIARPDNDQLVAYLENAGRKDLIEVKKSAAWGEFKKTLVITSDGQVVSEDGEIMDFITVEEKAGEFNVKI